MRKINKIIIHCSASDNPDQDNIDAVKYLHVSPKSRVIKWGEYSTHGRAWSDVGYHYFITKNGITQKGRPDVRAGAHVRGFNSGSIGVCLSGNKDFKHVQLKTLVALVKYLKSEYGSDVQVLGHCDLDSAKTCPNFDVKALNKFIKRLEL